MNPLLTSPGSCGQDSIIPIFPIQDFSKCVTEILSLVTVDDFISDLYLIDTQCVVGNDKVGCLNTGNRDIGSDHKIQDW